jgi:hypothetical protein
MEEKNIQTDNLKIRDNLDWLYKEAKAAIKRLDSRKGRGRYGMPWDDLTDYSIVGASSIAHNSLDFDAFSEEMLREFGGGLEFFMPGIHGQSQAMLDYSPEQVYEMISIATEEEGKKDTELANKRFLENMKLLKQLKSESRLATSEEKEILVKNNTRIE